MNWLSPLSCLLSLSVVASVFANEAEDAWYSISVKMKADKKNEAFRYVENQEGLPNVLIYGDSISIAYTPTVRSELEGKANVYRIQVNGGDSSSFIPKMDTLRETMKGHWTHDWDVVHFNVGLHDLKFVVKGKLDKVNGKQVSSLAEYEANLRGIIAYLKTEAPKAKLIFATTTPVPEGEAGRIAGDAAKFNEVARRVLRDFPRININDLYGFTKPHHSDWWSKPGNVHYNPDGIKAQGQEVARALRKVLR
jgi:lysophospholipase L1-like esterase